MLYDLGLFLTALVYGWIALDLLFARGWRRRFPGVALTALAIVAWASGELLLRRALTPEAVLEARCVLFAGVCALGPAWLWGASQAARTQRLRPWMLVAAAAPEAFMYSTFLWDRAGWFLDWTAVPAVHGPLFVVHAVYSWALLVFAFAMLARFLAQIVPGKRTFLVLGGCVAPPMVANASYLLLGVPSVDPTPIALGGVALFLRFVIVERGLAPHYLPFTRREVIDSLGVGIVVSDATGEVVDANAVAAEVAGVEQPVGMPLEQVIERARSQPMRFVEVTTSPLLHGAQRVGNIARIEDRTEMRAAERRLEIATRFEALGFLIAGVTHEINNPLAYLRGNLGLLDSLVRAIQTSGLHRQLPNVARRIAREGDSIVGDAIEGADRIARLVRRLGTFTHEAPRAAPTRPVDPAMLVRRAIDMATLGRRADLVELVEDEDLPDVWASEEDIVQVVLHLLINAIQAGGKRPPVVVEVRASRAGVVVRVLDRGPGIPDNLLPHVFDPFFTTKDENGSMGLGLSLGYDLARQNGGYIEVENRPDGGAAFTLWLPLRGSA